MKIQLAKKETPKSVNSKPPQYLVFAISISSLIQKSKKRETIGPDKTGRRNSSAREPPKEREWKNYLLPLFPLLRSRLSLSLLLLAVAPCARNLPCVERQTSAWRAAERTREENREWKCEGFVLVGRAKMGQLKLLLLLALQLCYVNAEILTPPYFNLAAGKGISATATCGVGTPGPELYCQLVGAISDQETNVNNQTIIQGQVCVNFVWIYAFMCFCSSYTSGCNDYDVTLFG